MLAFMFAFEAQVLYTTSLDRQPLFQGSLFVPLSKITTPNLDVCFNKLIPVNIFSVSFTVRMH